MWLPLRITPNRQHRWACGNRFLAEAAFQPCPWTPLAGLGEAGAGCDFSLVAEDGGPVEYGRRDSPSVGLPGPHQSLPAQKRHLPEPRPEGSVASPSHPWVERLSLRVWQAAFVVSTSHWGWLKADPGLCHPFSLRRGGDNDGIPPASPPLWTTVCSCSLSAQGHRVWRGAGTLVLGSTPRVACLAWGTSRSPCIGLAAGSYSQSLVVPLLVLRLVPAGALSPSLGTGPSL